jgi:DNA-binding XRE family transcriptional regulator
MAATNVATPTSPQLLRKQLRLSRERMARLLGVSAKTIERWEVRDGSPSTNTARERLAVMQRIVDLGLVVYGPERLNSFLSTPLREFDGLAGFQLIEIGQAERVLAALATDYEGIGT